MRQGRKPATWRKNIPVWASVTSGTEQAGVVLLEISQREEDSRRAASRVGSEVNRKQAEKI